VSKRNPLIAPAAESMASLVRRARAFWPSDISPSSGRIAEPCYLSESVDSDEGTDEAAMGSAYVDTTRTNALPGGHSLAWPLDPNAGKGGALGSRLGRAGAPSSGGRGRSQPMAGIDCLVPSGRTTTRCDYLITTGFTRKDCE
jgi:hypothetical protein